MDEPWVECPRFDATHGQPWTERLAQLPPAMRARGIQLLEMIRREIPARYWWIADWVNLRTWQRFQREARAIAGYVGATWREVLLANLTYDLTLLTQGCSTLALPTRDGPVLARNMDFWPEDRLAQTSTLLQVHEGPRLRLAVAGWPGAIGVVSGLSGRGFALALNAVLGPERFSKLGYPVLLFLRTVLEDAKNFQDALRRLARARLTVPGLVTLVGTENDERVVIERTPTRHALRWGEPDRPLVTTNHYVLLGQTSAPSSPCPVPREMRELAGSSEGRYTALRKQFLDDSSCQSISDQQLLYALTDPLVEQSITCQHVIARPRDNRLRLWVPRRLLAHDNS